ncbi:MAG TPA: class I SAM-dependent methyltransferase [Pelobium sp.]|nr:class I SAM-dependent methyltransferase [Pelobium sp.]
MKSALKKLIPKAWLRGYAELKNANKSAEEIFTEIYKKSYWGKTDGEQYFSGTGTHDQNTLKYVEVLVDFIHENNIKSVFEIGCGDFFIMKQILQQVDVDYIGADIVADLITHLQENHGNEQTNFIHFDATEAENYPDADLCVIRQVLQHLSNSQIQKILLKTKKFKHVIITEHVPANPEVINGDKSLNGYIRLQNAKTSGVFLDAPPFALKCETILSYSKDDEDLNGKIIPALMVSSLVVNN